MTILRLLFIIALVLLLGCTSSMPSLDAASVQTGLVTMPHGDRPTDDTWTLVYQTPVSFPRSFLRIPQVQLSVVAIEAYSRNSGTFYRVEAKQVTTSGFKLQVYGAYMRSFSNCTVSWTAIEG